MDEKKTKKQKFHFFKRFILSITDISAYSTFTREPLSKAIKYFFLLVLLLNIIPFLIFCGTLYKEINEFKSWLDNNLPKMTIKNGVFTCEDEQPIKLVYKDFLNFIIDTKDSINRIDPEIDACVLINSNKISIKFMQTTPQTIYIPENISLDIDKQTLENYQKKLFFTVLPFAAVIMYVVPLFQKLVEIVFFTLLLSIAYSVFCMRKNIPNAGRMKELAALSIYALTLPFCLEVLVGFSGFRFSYFIFIYYLIYLFYLFHIFRRVILIQPIITNTGGNDIS
jgi:hypothetical protein